MKRLLLISLFAFFACNPFEARTPEAGNSVSGQFELPTTWDITLTNLRDAFNANDEKGYLDCLLEPEFIFLGSDVSGTDNDQDWTFVQEEEYIRAQTSKQQRYLLSWDLSRETVEQTDLTHVKVTRPYEIKFIAEDLKIFEGQATFQICEVEDLWHIERWEDQRVVSRANPTWTTLKQNFR